MHSLTIQQFVDLTAATVRGVVNLSSRIDGCVIDSRCIQQGDAFFALPGRHEHGLKYAARALGDGAAVVVVDESASADCKTSHLTVPDAEMALAQVAYHNRQQSDALVIGVTGSVGKTTTRRMISAVLESTHIGIQSPKNFNNQLGVPLSLLELQGDDEFAVIEVGAAAPGEIGFLASIVQPEMAVVTRIAPTHLNGLKSLKLIQQEKAQLIQALDESGIAFLNADDPWVSELSGSTKGQVITFGTSESATIRATGIVSDGDQLRLTVDGCQYVVPVCGVHNVTNVLAAIAVGIEVGVESSQIASGLAGFQPQSGRCVLQDIGEWTVIDDTYNSSPASVSAAINVLDSYTDCHHRILVLNDMLDLGEQSPELHFGIGTALASSKTDHVLVTGQFSADVVEGFLAGGGSINSISQFSELSVMMTMLETILSADDVVLVKGSRATQMERVVQHLSSKESFRPEVSRAA